MSIRNALVTISASMALLAVAVAPASAGESRSGPAGTHPTAAVVAGEFSVLAGTCGTVTGDGVRIRTQPNPSSTVLGLAYRGHRVGFRGGISGDWQYIHNHHTGVTGWMHRAYINWDPVGSNC